MSRWSTEDVQGSETILYNTAMVATCRYTFVKAHTMCHAKGEPAANCGLWWTMMCQCRFIDDTERTSVVGDVSSDGGGACVGAGDMETLYIRSVLL